MLDAMVLLTAFSAIRARCGRTIPVSSAGAPRSTQTCDSVRGNLKPMRRTYCVVAN